MANSKTSGRTVVGLDVEPGLLAAAEVRMNGAVAVERAATAILDPGVVRDGEVADPGSLAEALKAFFSEHKLGRRVRVGVANQRIVMRTLDLPKIADPKDLDAAVRFQAQEHIPMRLDQAVLDFHSLGSVMTDEGERTRVVLVAARRDMIQRLLEAIRGAGLRPTGIDLSAFAVIRALGDVSAGGEEGVAGPALYINVAGMTNLAIAEGTMCRFTRVTSGGWETMIEGLAERRGLTLEHSRQWLSHVGLTDPIEAVEGDPEIVTEARQVLADGTRRVAEEVRNSLDYYRQEAAVAVSRAVLTGPAVAVRGFPEQLSADLGVPVETRVVAEARPGALAGIEPGVMTVAAGLAIQERGA
jgi:type IV pilus assembly protein PilM